MTAIIEGCYSCRHRFPGRQLCGLDGSTVDADTWCAMWACIAPGLEHECRWWWSPHGDTTDRGACRDGDCTQTSHGSLISGVVPGCSRWRPRPETEAS